MTHRPRKRCYSCKKPAPCPVFLEGRFEHGTAKGWHHGCGCDDCHAADPRRTGRTTRAHIGKRDDGIIDEVVVDRLVAGTLAWHEATLPERIEAGRRVIHREGGSKFCADVLHLRYDVIRDLRQGVAA